jgi:hypothetical protein
VGTRASILHGFRHAYGYTLQWSHTRWKAKNLSGRLAILRDRLDIFFGAIVGSQEIGGGTGVR